MKKKTGCKMIKFWKYRSHFKKEYKKANEKCDENVLKKERFSNLNDATSACAEEIVAKLGTREIYNFFTFSSYTSSCGGFYADVFDGQCCFYRIDCARRVQKLNFAVCP